MPLQVVPTNHSQHTPLPAPLAECPPEDPSATLPDQVDAAFIDVATTSELRAGSCARAPGLESPFATLDSFSSEHSTIIAESCVGGPPGPLVSRGQQDSTQRKQWWQQTTPLSWLPRQQFSHLIVYDLEATCSERKDIAPVEIIELSCVIVETSSYKIVDEYQSYVRPTEHPILDEFCTRLTGIQQSWVDQAATLGAVMKHHMAWLEGRVPLDDAAAVLSVTWTDWDLKVAMETECGWRHISKPRHMQRWADLKRVFAKKYRQAGNLRSSVEHAGLQWEGRAHSGLDDARNTARLALALMRGGAVLRPTGGFEGSEVSAEGDGPPPAAAPGGAASVPEHRMYGPDGQWDGKCGCGVAAHSRVTKKPGPNHGRAFFSCGRWRITSRRCCSFFAWAEDLASGARQRSGGIGQGVKHG